MPPPMPLNCSTIIFDLDGTISDPSLGIGRCFNYALTQHGIEPIAEQLIHNEIGPPLDQTFLKLAPDIRANQVDAFVKTYRERYADIGFSENSIYPGIQETLKMLFESGIKIGLCTSKRIDFADQILALFDVDKYFCFTDGGDIGISKVTQLEKLLANKTIYSDAIMVGDRYIDINAANKNELRSIAVLWGFGSLEELKEHKPSLILNKTHDLVTAVKYNGSSHL